VVFASPLGIDHLVNLGVGRSGPQSVHADDGAQAANLRDRSARARRGAADRLGLAYRAYGNTTLTTDGECERILRLTDAEVLDEARAEGVDVEAEAAWMRAKFEQTLKRLGRA
jgi:hypothetical protein